MKKIFFLLTIAAVLLSCEKAIMPNSGSADAEKTFETLWQTIDRDILFLSIRILTGMRCIKLTAHR
jgi:hypothetical protein